MLRDCIICNGKKAGEYAPEHWTVCIDCLQKGFMVCEADKKIFNKHERKFSPHIDQIQTVIVGNHDLLDEVNKSIKYMAYEDKVCDNTCYNILYLDKCIEAIQFYLNMNYMEEAIPILQNIKIGNNDARDKFNINLNNRIIELEQLKQKYYK